MPLGEGRICIAWSIIFWCGLFGLCSGVTYQLTAVPEKVALGQTLTITSKLFNPTTTDTDLRIILTQPGKHTLTIFQYRSRTGCMFLMEPFISTGTVVSCQPANSRYVMRFQSVTADHVGSYSLSAPLENPPKSSLQGVAANVQLLVAPTTVTVAPSRREVVEGQPTNFLCNVDDQATIPVSFVWKRIVNGNRVNPSAGSTTAMIPGGRSNRLSWNSVSRQHAGQYECRVSNEIGQLTSQLSTLVVYYPATSVTLSTSTGTTTVSVGTSVTFTCISTGGNPRPGLVIYDADSARTLKESDQSSSATLTYGPVSMQKSSNGAKYRCKTEVNVGAATVPGRRSNTLTMNVQFPPDDIKAPASVTVDEGQSTTIRCETTTSSNPKTELTWTGPAVGQSRTSESLGAHGAFKTGRLVTLTGDRIRNGATYTCTATHLGRQIYTQITTFNVKFAPKAIVFYDTRDTPIQENQERVLRCRAETSKPPGTINWRKIHNGIHSIVTSESVTEVPGDFGGTVLETSITSQPSRHDNGAKYWCEVDYTYTNGTKVTRRAPSKVLTNKGGTSITSIDVSVKYEPRLDPSVQQRLEVEAKIGETVILTLTILANPAPTSVKWRNTDGQDIFSSRFSESFNRNVYSLKIEDITERDYDSYRCVVTNSIGSSNFPVTVVRKREPPETPSYFTVTERTSSSLSLEWRPGSTGGTIGQVFLLDVITAREITQQHEVSDTTEPMVTFNVENLKPATDYRFKLQAKNDVNIISGSTEISAITKADMNDLIIKIIRFDETTVVVDWSTQDHLFLDYANSKVEVDSIASEQQVNVGLVRKAEARFGDRKLSIHVMEGIVYTFNVTVFDGDNIVFERQNLKAEKPTTSPIVTIAIASGLGACCLIFIVIVTVLCCKYKRNLSPQTSVPTTPGQSSAGFNNRAYEDENPYMEPVHHSPEEDCQYSEPGEANPYFYCQGNKYATVGDVSSAQKTDQSSDVRVSDNNVTIASDVIAPPNDYIDMTSQRRAAKARVVEIERSLGVSAGEELRPLPDLDPCQRSSLRPDSESEYVQMNRPQSAVTKESETLT